MARVCPLLLALACVLASVPARAGIRVSPLVRHVRVGAQLVIAVQPQNPHQDTGQPLQCHLVEPGGGEAWLEELEAPHRRDSEPRVGTHRIHYQPPGVATPSTFHLVITGGAPPSTLALTLHVLPTHGLSHPAAGVAFDALIHRFQGDDWMVAKMSRLADFSQPPNGPGMMPAPVAPADGDFAPTIRCLRFLEDDPDLGDWNQKWLVGLGDFLRIFDTRNGPHGARQISFQEDLPVGTVRALAVRPRGSAPDSPVHVVFARRIPEENETFIRRTTDYYGVWALVPGSKEPRQLAGLEPEPGAARLRQVPAFQNGPARQTFLGAIDGLVVDPHGVVFLAEATRGLILRLARHGDGWGLSLLAGHQGDGPIMDGTGPAAKFGALRGLTLDGDGNLYVIDGDSIRRITPAGVVTTLFGVPRQSGNAPANLGPHPEQMPPGTACLRRPAALDGWGRKLFIADTGNRVIRVFDLDTRILQTVVGDPSQQALREGPIRLLHPERPPQDCAALPSPSAIALTFYGQCVAAQDQSLFRLYLGPLTELPPAAIPAAGAP